MISQHHHHHKAAHKMDSTKRPRTSTACVRCHLKKVRCDGRRPNCDRCAANDKMCAYPTRRRSRNTQPADVDPFIDDLSQLEQRIRGIETEQEALWHVLQQADLDNNSADLVSRLTTIDQHVQTSRASLARQRLLREQHIARNKQNREKQQQPVKKTKQDQPPQAPWVVNESWLPVNSDDYNFHAKNGILSPTTDLNFATTPPQQPLLYPSSSTSTVHSSSSASPSSSTTPLPSFHPVPQNNNEMMVDPSSYGLMNFVMDEDPLMLNYHQEGDPWLGHPRL
ncbi:hypothetical protein BJV82DRAFT_601214 [Fennellomyces sp. T-0311]|nr:hypothetical protein BJV82DRAFT_601214 [Fennellomyces sp. T-0311]